MATWTLSDGTKLRTGGKVEGHSALAQRLRERAQAVRAGTAVWISTSPPPGGLAPLNLDDDVHLDCWVRDVAFGFGVVVESAPEMPRPRLPRPADID